MQPISELSGVRSAIDAVRGDHPGANHVVHAAVVGDSRNSLQFGAGDDGEPKGTAGRPSLEVLKGSGITNVLLTTVRYFGGVKLGTGGLVRAYADAVRAVALVANTEPLVELSELRLELGYEVHEAVRRAVCDAGAQVEEERFGTTVNMRLVCEVVLVDRVVAAATDAARGAIIWEGPPRSCFS